MRKLFIFGLLLLLMLGGSIWVFRQRHRSSVSSCINNLRQLDGAKQQWAVDYKKNTNDIPVWEDLVGKYFNQKPECPQGGTYTIGKVGEAPRCNFPGHKLE